MTVDGGAEAGVEVRVEEPVPGEEAPPDQIPFVLFCVFGLPIFMTFVWFIMRFTSPDRGTMQLAAMKALDEAEEEDDESAPE